MAKEKARMLAGAAMLDEVLPGWWDGKEKFSIDLVMLDMNNIGLCVLGQCFGDYHSGTEKLGFEGYAQQAKDLGFNQEQGAKGYARLDAVWKAEIRRRRKAAGHA